MLRGCESIPSHIKKLAGAETLAEAWQKCEDGHELIRLCGAMIGTEGWPTKQEILLVVCDCADTVLPCLPKEDTSSRECVRVSRLWAEREATVEEIKRVVEIAACDSRVSPTSPAYSVAYAASCAAEADAHAAAGRADAASDSSFKFMCVTNAVPLFRRRCSC
jgi:hypothetical protein